jgi:LAGLIDADG endonuclease
MPMYSFNKSTLYRVGELSSDNHSAADNQQERLIKIGWITGFVDGEGCFSIHVVRQPHRANRRGYRTGFQVAHQFVVTQGAKSITCLQMMQQFFGVGRLHRNRRNDNHKEDLYQFVVRRRNDLLQTIIPFFQRYPLRTAKSVDFEKFAACMTIIQSNEHIRAQGLLQILEIMQTMNHCKPRTEMIRILRDYTPNADDLFVGEDIVRTAWRHAEVRPNHLDSEGRKSFKINNIA